MTAQGNDVNELTGAETAPGIEERTVLNGRWLWVTAGLLGGAVLGLVWRAPIVHGLILIWAQHVGPAFETLLNVDLPYC